MNDEHKQSDEDERLRRISALHVRASRLGWEAAFEKECQTLEDIRRIEIMMLQQEGYRADLNRRFMGKPPLWVRNRLHFPLNQDWFDALDASVELDERWRRHFEERKLAIHPSFHSKLPQLPELIDEQTLVPLLQGYEHIEGELLNRVWRLFYKVVTTKAE